MSHGKLGAWREGSGLESLPWWYTAVSLGWGEDECPQKMNLPGNTPLGGRSEMPRTKPEGTGKECKATAAGMAINQKSNWAETMFQ